MPDSFIHGALLEAGGTCATLPVLYTAIGRRLGYPLKLVTAWGPRSFHVFCRWDQPGGERFNVEVNASGVSFPDDDYYRRFGQEPSLEKAGHFLESHRPRQELAGFLVQRGFHFREARNLRQCVNSLGWAAALCPDDEFHRGTVNGHYNLWLREVKQKEPPGFPEVWLKVLQRRYPEGLPFDLEREMLCLEMTENLLKDREWDQKWWEPLRRGWRWVRSPRKVLVDSKGDGFTCSFEFST